MTPWFMRDVIRLLAEGWVIRFVFSLTLRLGACGVALTGLLAWIGAWKLVFRLPAAGILGGIVFQLAFVVGIAAVVQAFWLRAGSIARLEEGELTVLPIAALVVRLLGESYLCFIVPVSIGGGIFLWLSQGDDTLLSAVDLLVPGSSSGSFLGGILLMVGGTVAGFAALIASYFIAETIIVVADIARNTRAIRRVVETEAGRLAGPVEQPGA